MDDNEEALEVWRNAASDGPEALRGFDVPAILLILIARIEALEAALREIVGENKQHPQGPSWVLRKIAEAALHPQGQRTPE